MPVVNLAGSSKLLRAMNSSAALSLLFERGRLTRGELREATGLSKPTVSDALRRLVDDAKDRLRNTRQIMIFPEGTRTTPGDEASYKPGIAALYRELDMPCIPMATNSGMHWPSKSSIRTPGTIVFEFLPAIPPGLKRGEFMRELEERIETASKALYAE